MLTDRKKDQSMTVRPSLRHRTGSWCAAGTGCHKTCQNDQMMSCHKRHADILMEQQYFTSVQGSQLLPSCCRAGRFGSKCNSKRGIIHKSFTDCMIGNHINKHRFRPCSFAVGQLIKTGVINNGTRPSGRTHQHHVIRQVYWLHVQEQSTVTKSHAESGTGTFSTWESRSSQCRSKCAIYPHSCCSMLSICFPMEFFLYDCDGIISELWFCGESPDTSDCAVIAAHVCLSVSAEGEEGQQWKD